MKVTARQDREPIVDGILSGQCKIPGHKASLPLITSGGRLLPDRHSAAFLCEREMEGLAAECQWRVGGMSSCPDPSLSTV